MNKKLTSKTLLTIGFIALSSFSTAWAESEDDDRDEAQESSLITSTSVIEGKIIKVKEKNNEIYVRTLKGEREEIYLDKNASISSGSQQLKISDLKKDMNVKVSGKNKVEVLK